MATGLQANTQPGWEAGAFPGHEIIPPNGALSIENGLIADDGAIIRRGGSRFLTTTDVSENLISVWDGFTVAGHRTAMASTGVLFAVSGDGVTPQVLRTLVSPDVFGNPNVFGPGGWVEVNNFVIRMKGGLSPGAVLWAGALDQPDFAPSGETITFTEGSRTVTTSGAPISTVNMKRGGIISVAANSFGPTTGPIIQMPAVIDKVTDASHLELVDPWPFRTVTTVTNWKVSATLEVDFSSGVFGSGSGGPLSFTSTSPTVGAQIFGRLVVAQGKRIFPSDFSVDSDGNQYSALTLFDTNEGLTLPEGTVVYAMTALRSDLLVFTSAGVWAVRGLDNPDATDDFGNPVWAVEQINRDVVAAGVNGVASWRNALVVPAVDDVYLFDGVGAPIAMTGGARESYRDLVKQGFVFAPAVVYRGHYLLPVLDSTGAGSETLVWRLDLPGAPFSTWTAHAGRAVALASSQSRLLAATGKRVSDLSDVFDPSVSVARDADSTAHMLRVETRTFTSGNTFGRSWRKVRLRCQVDGVSDVATAMAASYATGAPGNTPTVLGNPTTREGQ